MAVRDLLHRTVGCRRRCSRRSRANVRARYRADGMPPEDRRTHAQTPGSPVARIGSTGLVDRHRHQRRPTSTRLTDASPNPANLPGQSTRKAPSRRRMSPELVHVPLDTAIGGPHRHVVPTPHARGAHTPGNAAGSILSTNPARAGSALRGLRLYGGEARGSVTSAHSGIQEILGDTEQPGLFPGELIMRTVDRGWLRARRPTQGLVTEPVQQSEWLARQAATATARPRCGLRKARLGGGGGGADRGDGCRSVRPRSGAASPHPRPLNTRFSRNLPFSF